MSCLTLYYYVNLKVTSIFIVAAGDGVNAAFTSPCEMLLAWLRVLLEADWLCKSCVPQQ